MKKILVLGSSNTDMTVQAEVLPAPGETVLGGDFKMSAGGKGANQAVAAARSGGEVAFVCKVGKDMFGDKAIAHYEREGIDVSGVLRSDKPSGIALISVDSRAENCIVVASGANLDFTDEDIDAMAEEIRSCGILLMQLEIPVPAVLKAAKMAHEAGACVILNPAPYSELPDEIFRYITMFIPNQTELSQFSGIKCEDEETAVRAAKVLLDRGIRGVIVTLGSRGSLIVDKDGALRMPPYKVNAVDTTGAGDTYCGAFSVALAEGKPLEEAARFASAAAALAVTKMGAQTAIPLREETEAFMAEAEIQTANL